VEQIDIDDRRARLFARHHLSLPATAVDDAVAAVVGLHSSDPVTVYLSARARVQDFTVRDLEDALYERRSVVRMLGMRRTMFIVPRATAAIMDAACTQALVPGQRQRLVKMLEEQGIASDGGAWVDRMAERTFDAIVARGQATAAELTAAIPELNSKVTFGEGRKWAGTSGVTTRVLFLLATEGRIVRGRPLGSWTSSQYRWAPTETWLGEGLDTIEPAESRRELLRRWLRAFGPGTEIDIRWWTGWTAKQTRAALQDVGAVEVQLEGGVGHVLANDLSSPPAIERRVALLPGLDLSVMGWKERDWYLGENSSRLFDSNGNAGPTVWVDGRVVGGWGQRPDAKVVTRLLEPVDSEAEAMVEHEAAELTVWLAGTRVTPRFRTPVEKELAG
jgi:DNA glycosylase AlkZ-like